MTLDEHLDELYQSPLEDFVANRNALAAALKKGGNEPASKRVKALTKPSASAWAVNQVYWKERAVFDALIGAGDRLRESLESTPSESAERDRHEAVEAAIRSAHTILEASSQKPSDILMRRVATTLDALASYGSSNPDPMTGRLSKDLDPAGFGAFAALAPNLPEPTKPTLVDTLAEREEALDRARSRLDEATSRIARVEKELGAVQQRLLDAEKAAEEAAIQVAESEARLEEAKANNAG